MNRRRRARRVDRSCVPRSARPPLSWSLRGQEAFREGYVTNVSIRHDLGAVLLWLGLDAEAAEHLARYALVHPDDAQTSAWLAACRPAAAAE